jgi:hypothetical protein
MRWTTTLHDGTEIRVQREMVRRRALWWFQMDLESYGGPSRFFDSAGQAEDAAIAAYKARRKR